MFFDLRNLILKTMIQDTIQKDEEPKLSCILCPEHLDSILF